MPKYILEFNIPEEQWELEAAMKGASYKCNLEDIDNKCRSLLKHGDPSEELEKFAEEIREMIRGE